MKKASVLIVDDKPEGLFSVEAVLRASNDNNFDVLKASSGPEAIDQVNSNELAVILLDVQMPGMDGFETARRIREIDNLIPIIFITAISHDEMHVFKGYDSGAVDYLFKPLNARVLRSKVNVFIDLFNKDQALKEQTRLLREHEQREHARQYKNLADAVPHLIFKTDEDDFAHYFNKGWISYTGMTEEQSSGRGWKHVIQTNDLLRFTDKWQGIKKNPRSFEIEIRIRRQLDHMDRWHLMRGVPELNPDGRVTSWLFSCTDIHDAKETMEKLEERTRDLERSNSDLEQFAYVTSHDLQEPLRKVTSYVDLLQIHTNGELNEKAKKALEPIVNGVKRMHQLINDLLNYSRVIKEDGTAVRPVDLAVELANVIDTIPGGKEAEISVQPLPVVQGSRVQIRQLFQNLLSNALKFQGKDPIHIEVGAERSGEEWIISVKDNGIGIPKDYREKIFVIFQRLHSRDRYPGTGIGLSICKKIVENTGGRIWVESEVGKGATFYFTLPVLEKEVAVVG